MGLASEEKRSETGSRRRGENFGSEADCPHFIGQEERCNAIGRGDFGSELGMSSTGPTRRDFLLTGVQIFQGVLDGLHRPILAMSQPRQAPVARKHVEDLRWVLGSLVFFLGRSLPGAVLISCRDSHCPRWGRLRGGFRRRLVHFQGLPRAAVTLLEGFFRVLVVVL